MTSHVPGPEDKESAARFEEHVLRFQDGTLSQEELAEFSALLAGNPERQRLLIEIQFRSALIREILQCQAYDVPDSIPRESACPVVSRSPETWRTRSRLRKGMAVAALMLALFGGHFLWRYSGWTQPGEDVASRSVPASGALPPAPQARVVGVSRASFFGRGGLEVGQSLPSGYDCMLRTGMVKLAFPSGATAIIEGPALFRVVDTEALAIDTGVCSVHAPDGAEGFRVITPVTQVVDRGTRFSVKVSESTETEVQVVEGAADLIASDRPRSLSGTRPSASHSEVRLTEQQAVRFSGFGADQQQPVSFRPQEYRHQLPDRIVNYKASTTESGAVRELQQIAVQRKGIIRIYAADELIPVEITAFRGEDHTDSNGHLLGGENPPQQRHGWLEDLRLDTGVINFGGGPTPLTHNPILQGPEATPGLGVRFRSPVTNQAGPEIVFFEIQCFTNPLEGDPFHVSPVQFRPGLRTRTITHYDLIMSSPESHEVPPFWLYRYFEPVRSLDDLSRMPVEPNGGVMRLHFRALAVGIDLSDLGFADGEQVEELFFQHASVGGASQVDPVLIAGLPRLNDTENPLTPSASERMEEVKK